MLNCDKSSLLSRVCLMKIIWFWLLRPGFPEDELDISLQSASFLIALSVTFSITGCFDSQKLNRILECQSHEILRPFCGNNS